MIAVELRNLNKRFTDLEVLNQINVTVEKEQFVSIIGPSGCGKSTLFKLITGLDSHYDGSIIFNEQENTKLDVGYMPQKDLLLPWKTVLKNVTLPLTIKNEKIDSTELDELIELFGLKGFESSYPKDLSGGMRQRAALLRTMLMGNEVLLLDEPFGAIDSINRLKLQKWLLDVFNTHKKSILFITHDIDEAILLSNKIYVLSDRPATVLKEIEIEFDGPRDETIITTQPFNDYKKMIMSLLTK